MLDGPFGRQAMWYLLRETCWKVCRRGMSMGWREAVAKTGSWPSKIHSLYGSYSCIWDFRRVVRKTSICGFSLGLEGVDDLSGVRVIFLWFFVKV